MNTSAKTSSALKGLIIINNDRYEGYKTAAAETKDADLKALFDKFSSQSRLFASELKASLPNQDKDPEDATTASGKLYRVWMDVKSALAANNRKAVLSSCEFGEDAALKAYEEVLEKPENILESQLFIIRKQKKELQESHDTIKSLRDRS